MLVVTTTVRVVHWVHSHTSGSWPAVFLHLVLVERSSGLQQWLVDSSTTSNNTNNTSGIRRDDFFGTGWQLDSSLVLLGIVSNDDDVVTGGSTQSTSVTRFLLDVGDDGTLRASTQWQDVTDVQGSLGTTVHELAGVDTLVGYERLLSQSVPVWISEGNLGQRSASTRVVDDLLDNTADVALTLGVVQGSQLCSTFS